MVNLLQNTKKKPVIISILITAVIVTVEHLLASGKYGFFSGSIHGLVEELLFESILNISGDIFWYIGLFIFSSKAGVILILTIIIYCALVGLIVWHIQHKKIIRLIIIMAAIIFVVAGIYVQGREYVFSESQCVTSKVSNKLFSIKRECRGMYRPNFSIPQLGGYDNASPLVKSMFNGIVISKNEFDELKKHKGNLGYFCNTGCGIDEYSQCSYIVDKVCKNCVESCRNEYRSEVSHVVDFLKSTGFLECFSACKP